ncbi:MAG: preprotein translocase subunit YajC [Clostridia bacterium]|nr:preprotein translocase subunit YajC [Clostridia bacterium]
MIIKPQRKQQKLRQEMLSNLKVGDNVVTLGGIHGKIVRITDDIIKLEVAENVRLKMQREAVNFVVEDED